MEKIVKSGDDWNIAASPSEAIEGTSRGLGTGNSPVAVTKYEIVSDIPYSHYHGHMNGFVQTEAWRENGGVRIVSAMLKGTLLGVPVAACEYMTIPETNHGNPNWYALAQSYTALCRVAFDRQVPLSINAINWNIDHPWYKAKVIGVPLDAPAQIPRDAGLVLVRARRKKAARFVPAPGKDRWDMFYAHAYEPNVSYDAFVRLEDVMQHGNLARELMFTTGLTKFAVLHRVVTGDTAPWEQGEAFHQFAYQS